jgi:NADH dehydrogenase
VEHHVEEQLKNIVVIGAGYGGLTAALRLARLFSAAPDFRVHLVDKYPFHTLKTQLHEAAVHKSEVTIDIGRIIRRQHNISFQLGVVTAIDLTGRTITLADRSISFDYLVLALGSQANFYKIPGLEQFALPLQSAWDAERINQHISSLCAKASSEPNPDRRKEMLRFVIGGGGLSGIEFAGELVDFVAQSSENYHLPPDESEIIVVEAADDILPASDKGVREQIRKKLSDKGVRTITGTRVVEVSPGMVTLSTGGTLHSQTIVWTGGIRITHIARESGIAIGESGRIVVNGFLQSAAFPNVYAIGDNALAVNPKTGRPVPAAAQFALQQGRLVAENLHAVVLGKEQRPYQPRVWGEVISLGRHLAVGWVALPLLRKLQFVGFLGSLLKSAIKGKHILLLKKESRNWMSY